jgi:hypothetical protein
VFSPLFRTKYVVYLGLSNELILIYFNDADPAAEVKYPGLKSECDVNGD